MRPLQPRPTYTIGVEGPFSGSDANYGDYIYGGVQLAINAANASGKYKFTLKPEKFDDQGSSSLSPAAAQKAVGTKNLIADRWSGLLRCLRGRCSVLLEGARR